MKGKTYTLTFALFVLTLGAGVAAGMLAARLPGSPAPDSSPSEEVSPLAEQLQLTSDQQVQMKLIWENMRGQAHDCLTSARRIQKDRDDAIVALLTDQQKEKYRQISDDFVRKFSDLNDKRDKAFQQSVDKTMLLLNETQRERYRKIIEDRTGRIENEPVPASAP